MNAIHHFTGYENGTERLEIEYDIPPCQFPALRRIAIVPPSDVDAIEFYRLTPEPIPAAAAKLSKSLDADAYDCYLEPFAED